MSLENAPDEVKLAVDLIVLLEENQLLREPCYARWKSLCVIMKTSSKARKTARNINDYCLVERRGEWHSRRNNSRPLDGSWNDFPLHRTMRFSDRC